MPTLRISIISLLILISCNGPENNSGIGIIDPAASTDSGMLHKADSVKNTAALPPMPSGAKVYFKNLINNEVVKSPLKVVMGVKNIKVDSAGIIAAGEGHHHILIDAGDSVAAGQVIPKDAQHLHFGKGQTSATLDLPKGKHRLTLQFADGIHRSYGSTLSATIEITVK